MLADKQEVADAPASGRTHCMAGANFGREKNTKVSLARALHKWPEYGWSIPEVARQSGKGYL